jgi:Cdc6-like AAA superfamily ATPase
VPLKPANSSRGKDGPLIDRDAEFRELDSLLEALPRGESRSLGIHGKTGVGKTALLGYLTDRASGCQSSAKSLTMGPTPLSH